MNNPFISHDAPTKPVLVPHVPNLDDLARALMDAKKVLDAARKGVTAAEDALVQAVGARVEGSFTVNSDHFKVTTTAPVRRTVNPAQLEAIRHELPRALYEAMFHWKPELNMKNFRACEELDPEAYKLVCKAITSKPGKIAVKVERFK